MEPTTPTQRLLDFLKKQPLLARAVAVPYGFCWVACILLAGFVVLSEPSSCEGVPSSTWPGMYGVCGYGDSLFLLLTTLHAGAWGNLVPGSHGQLFIVGAVSALGYLWPLAAVLEALRLMKQKTLAKLGGLALLTLYLSLAFVGNLVFAAMIPPDGLCKGGEGGGCGSFNARFYFAWQTFHLRAYGDLSPEKESTGSFLISLFIAMSGSFCWLAPMLMISRRSAIRSPSQRLLSNLEGGFRTILRRAAFAILLPYAVCLFVLLVLLGIYVSADPTECDYDCDRDRSSYFLLLLTTFHGVTYGHLVPVTGVQQAVVCIVASMGYLLRQVVLALLLRSVSQFALVRRQVLILSANYILWAVVGCSVLAALNGEIATRGSPACDDECRYSSSFYYIWMSFHGRPYGDLHPVSTREKMIALVTVTLGHIAWAVPLVAMLRLSVLCTVLETSSEKAEPEIIGNQSESL